MLKDETYLGDAVYASFDGFNIWLRTGDGENQRIALEPSVFAALVDYAINLRNRIRREALEADPTMCSCNEPGIFHERGAPICKHAGEQV